MGKAYRIALIPGDGIGPELTEATMKVWDAVEESFGIRLEALRVEAGDACLERRGVALPQETIDAIKASDACLKGPVGNTAADVIVRLRLLLDLYANIRPIKAYPGIPAISPDIDFVIVRENTEDVYRGLEFQITPDDFICLRVITRKGCERIAKYAFEEALRRRKGMKVTAVHKANVMKLTCGLFAETCRSVAKAYPSISYEELLVDTAAMQLIKRPESFDVLVTTNMFGDILSDEAAQTVGGLGMAPGANIGEKFAIFEPVHGCAPKYAGKQYANPCSMILATALMLLWLGNRRGDDEAVKAGKAIDEGVASALKRGQRTRDLGGKLGTSEMGDAVAKEVRNLAGII